jgi:capsid portal protein
MARKKTKPDTAGAMKDNVIDSSNDSLSMTDFMAKARAAITPGIDETKAATIIKKQQDDVEEAGAVYSGYDPESLMAIAETSDSLAPNIAAYVQNIESNGHRFEIMKGLDLESDKIDDRLKTVIYMDRWITARDAARLDESKKKKKKSKKAEETEIDAEITDTEIEELKTQLKRQAMRERFLAEAWFDNCGIDVSFSNLRERKRKDEESVGHAGWECIRDSYGDLIRLSHIAGYTLYPVIDDGVGVQVEQTERISPLTTRTVTVLKYFPRYVQVLNGEKIYYKTIGDPRIISRFSGKPYKTENALIKAEREKYLKEDEDGNRPDDKELLAHEIIWFEIWSPRTPAGVPRWIGALLNVLGSRGASEINYQYIDNKSIPPAILAVSGKMNRQAKEYLRNMFATHLKGRKNWDKIVILDDAVMNRKADPAVGSDRKTWAEFIPLMDLQRGDSLFQEYSKNNRDTVGSQFRQPPALRGETPKDLNRATYLGSLQYGEQQVYSQPRKAFDWTVNHLIMPEILGPGHIIEFVSNSPMVSDPVERAKLVDVYGKQGGLVPEDIRALASEDFNKQLAPIDAAWSKQPLALTLATGGGPVDTDEAQGQLEELEDRLSGTITQALRTQGFGDDIKAIVRLPQDADEELIGDLDLGDE